MRIKHVVFLCSGVMSVCAVRPSDAQINSAGEVIRELMNRIDNNQTYREFAGVITGEYKDYFSCYTGMSAFKIAAVNNDVFCNAVSYHSLFLYIFGFDPQIIINVNKTVSLLDQNEGFSPAEQMRLKNSAHMSMYAQFVAQARSVHYSALRDSIQPLQNEKITLEQRLRNLDTQMSSTILSIEARKALCDTALQNRKEEAKRRKKEDMQNIVDPLTAQREGKQEDLQRLEQTHDQSILQLKEELEEGKKRHANVRADREREIQARIDAIGEHSVLKTVLSGLQGAGASVSACVGLGSAGTTTSAGATAAGASAGASASAGGAGTATLSETVATAIAGGVSGTTLAGVAVVGGAFAGLGGYALGERAQKKQLKEAMKEKDEVILAEHTSNETLDASIKEKTASKIREYEAAHSGISNEINRLKYNIQAKCAEIESRYGVEMNLIARAEEYDKAEYDANIDQARQRYQAEREDLIAKLSSVNAVSEEKMKHIELHAYNTVGSLINPAVMNMMQGMQQANAIKAS